MLHKQRFQPTLVPRAAEPRALHVNEMSQTQNIVDIQMLDGSTSRAIVTGNNAAWICICKRSEPLLGRTGSLKGVSAATRIDCPACGRKYFVVPKGKDQGPVAKVLEVK